MSIWRIVIAAAVVCFSINLWADEPTHAVSPQGERLVKAARAGIEEMQKEWRIGQAPVTPASVARFVVWNRRLYEAWCMTRPDVRDRVKVAEEHFEALRTFAATLKAVNREGPPPAGQETEVEYAVAWAEFELARVKAEAAAKR